VIWMPIAFVLMSAEPGAEKSIVDELNSIDGVTQVFPVYGVYDVIARIEAKDMYELRETILHCIRKRKGIQSTSTMIVSED